MQKSVKDLFDRYPLSLARDIKERKGRLMLASHQPDFFPWMGYFYKIYQSDIFVFSDNVLYSKTGRHNYNLILTGSGPMKFTIPIHYHTLPLNELKLAADEQAVKKMLKTIVQEYRKAYHFEEAYPVIERLFEYALEAESLADFNMTCIMELCRKFGLTDNRAFYVSSNLDLKNRKDARIIEMCGFFGADSYYSGVAAKDYHIEEDYRANGISLVYSDYEPVIYPQFRGDTVINMSVIDYVMNVGFSLPEVWNNE